MTRPTTARARAFDDDDRRRELTEGLLATLRGGPWRGAAKMYEGASLDTFELMARIAVPGATHLAGSTTSDWALVLRDTFQRRMMDLYAAAVSVARLLAAPISLRDYRPATLIRVGDLTLKQVGESGEVETFSLADGGETIQLRRFSRIFGLTNAAFRNNDVFGFNEVVRVAAGAVQSAEDAAFINMLQSNPTLLDGTAYFHTNRGNIVGPSALDATSLAVAVAALRKQLAPSGAPLNLGPRFVLVGPDAEGAGLKAVLALTPPGIRPLEVVVDARLGTDWYVVADPSSRAAFVRGTRFDRTAPDVLARTGFSDESVEWRVSHDFAIGPADPRAVVRNLGA